MRLRLTEETLIIGSELEKELTEISITKLRKRLIAGLLAITSVFLALFCRLFYLQVIWGDFLQAKALDQWTRELPIVAERGKIYDRNGILLVDNKPSYSVYMRPRSVENSLETATALSEIFDLDFEKTLKRAEHKSVSEYTIAKQVDAEKIDRLLDYDLKGVYYSKDNTRNYPYGEFLSQVLGYVSIDNYGQTGIEKYYDEYLKGDNGEILYETDLLGIELEGKNVKYLSATEGLSLRLTIDYEIQLIAENLMEQAYETHNPKSAEMLVVDPSNGQILAMAIKPSYDLNEIPREDVVLLNKLSRNGLAVDSYEPGSTFKILTAAANIEETLKGNEKAIPLDYVYNSNRYRYLTGSKIKCWNEHKNGKHSNQTLKDALNNSCNPCFVDIALSLGKSTMYDYIRRFNYGTQTGIDFIGEASGMVLPETAVKEGDLARIAFGQTIAVTPLQLAFASASAINGGYYYEPQLLHSVYGANKLLETIEPVVKNRTISVEASAILAGYLEGVVSDGSGKQAYIEGYKVGGKTGTAQKYVNGAIAQGKYIASFVGFFPSDAPKYLALVIVDEPQGMYFGSQVAAPYAKMLFERIISAKNL